jgi:hypothetical protein
MRQHTGVLGPHVAISWHSVAGIPSGLVDSLNHVSAEEAFDQPNGNGQKGKKR